MYFRRNWCGAVQQVSWISAQCQTAKTGWIYYTKLSVRLLVHIQRIPEDSLPQSADQVKHKWFSGKDWTGRCGKGLSECRGFVLSGWNTMQDTSSKNRFPLFVPDQFETQWHTYSLLGGNCWFCSRRKMCTHHHTEDKDGRHHPH